MRLHTDTVHVERSGVLPEKVFNVKMTAKAFDILSSGLYTDPIRAIVRELSCNAYDAHVAAGKANVPFEIHLPTHLEPWFAIKDFGTGLSHEDLMTTYTTYFESTKTESNDYIGALGLGSKSPFSYTDAYTVTSRHNGKRRVYSIFFNEERLPSVALLAEDDTDEENGLEVNIAIKRDDFSKFITQVQSAFTYFKVKPRITGSASFYGFESLPQTAYSGDRWVVYKKEGWRDGSFTAVQGQVPYRVNIQQLANSMPAPVVEFLKKLNVVAFFDIGELEVAANREEIRYDARSVQALCTRIAGVRSKFIEQLEKQANEVTNEPFWKTFIRLRALSHQLFGTENGLALFVQDDTTDPVLSKFCSWTKTTGYVVSDIGVQVTKYRATGRPSAPLEREASNTDAYTNMNGTVAKHISIEPAYDRIVIVDDVAGNSSMKLVKQYLRTQNTSVWKKVIVIKPLTAKKAEGLVNYPAFDASKTAAAARVAKLIENLGNPEYKILSQISEKEVDTEKRPMPIYYYDGFKRTGRYRSRTCTIEWKSDYLQEADLKKGGLYIPLNKFEIVLPNGESAAWNDSKYESTMQGAVQLINVENKTNYQWKTDVAGVGAYTLKRIKMRGAKWVDVLVTANDIVDKHKDLIIAYAKVSHMPSFFGLKSILAENLLNGKPMTKQDQENLKLVEDLDADSTLLVMIKPYIEAIRKLKGHEAIARAAYEFDFNVSRRHFKRTFDIDVADTKTKQKLEGQYPLLSFVDHINYNKVDAFIQYVKLIDRSTK